MKFEISEDWREKLAEMARPVLSHAAEDIAADIRATIIEEDLIDTSAMLNSVGVVDEPDRLGVVVGTDSVTPGTYSYTYSTPDGERTVDARNYAWFLELGTQYIAEKAFVRKNLFKLRELR